jgi:hypothetical protein
MSRVVYTETATTVDQHSLRDKYQLRVVSSEEEGCGVDALPNGVYGFTYSPGLPSAPMFATRRYRNYETQKRADGSTYVLGFTSPEVAAQLDAGVEEVTVELFPEPSDDAAVHVALAYARMIQNRQHAAPNQESFTAVIGQA